MECARLFRCPSSLDSQTTPESCGGRVVVSGLGVAELDEDPTARAYAIEKAAHLGGFVLARMQCAQLAFLAGGSRDRAV